jgi:hypothetical protein
MVLLIQCCPVCNAQVRGHFVDHPLAGSLCHITKTIPFLPLLFIYIIQLLPEAAVLLHNNTPMQTK